MPLARQAGLRDRPPDVRAGRAEVDAEWLGAICAPQPFLLMGSGPADGAKSCPCVWETLKVYRLYGLYGEPRRLGFFNHEQGHSVPPVAGLRASSVAADVLVIE